MSINTTSTSDRLAADSVASSPAQEENVQNYRGASALVSAPPDAAAIAKLATEFFAALPTGPTFPDAAPAPAVPHGMSMPAAPTGVPLAAVPDFPREMFSLPVTPNAPAAPAGAPQLPFSPSTEALHEADFRAIAASLAGVMGLVPQFPAGSSSTAVPGDPSAPADLPNAGPWAAPPRIPPAAEMYSFPGFPGVTSVPPTGPPSGSDIAGAPASLAAVAAVAPGAPPPLRYPAPDNSGNGRADPWASDPIFPTQNEVFSFPRVPGASVPGVPQLNPSQPSLPVSEPVVGTIPAAPSVVPKVNASEFIPDIPKAPPAAIPEGSGDLTEREPASPMAIAPKIPAASQMFSFPGVPGAQSPPGAPVVPSSVPVKSPSEPDLRALARPFPGATVAAPQVPGVPHMPAPGLPDGEAATQPASPNATSLPRDVESVEFRPDVVPDSGLSRRPLDPQLIRQDFPILQERVNGRPLIWLDNAATTQKPNAVIDRLSYFYCHENSNIHRAAHTLAARATDAYESAREKTRRFLNASSTREIIFVRGTTEGINLIAQSWGRRNVEKDDEIVITWLEHHANIVPWQQLCSEKGARLRVAPVNDRGEVMLEEYERLLGPRTRIVSLSQVSNALGTITPAREMVQMAHRHGARVVVDGAQAVSHMRVDVQALDCDFYVFSGHKIFGPTGIGAVYGKLEVLDNMPPWHGGGNMIVDVTFDRTTYQAAPARFEAGTGNIADAVGLGAALDYVEQVGMENISAYEHELLSYATAGLLTVPGLRLIGTAREKASVLSFVLDDVRTEDVGAALNQDGIAVRSGHHCAQPILRRMGVEATVRPSLAFYNTREDVDELVAALLRLQAGRSRRTQ